MLAFRLWWTNCLPMDRKTALVKLQKFCAYQERCEFEILAKLGEWELNAKDIARVMSQLKEENFFSNTRFAEVFAGGKFRMKCWGRLKIADELRKRHINEKDITFALQQISPEDYREALKQLLVKKAAELHEEDDFTRNGKLATYAMSHGYETGLVWETIKMLKVS